MSFFKKIFSPKEFPLTSNADFWNWFQQHEKVFYNIVKTQNNIEKDFFNKLSKKLAELKDGYFYLAGMSDDNTAELIITADGYVKNIVFVEELIAAAPTINGWKFTALKPSLDIEDVNIKMSGQTFNQDNIFFYSKDLSEYPDEVMLSVTHLDMDDENRQDIINGTFIFLENYIGELDFINLIDDVEIISKHEAEKELVPISKLMDYLVWRQKEFIENYQGVRYNTENDEYSVIEAVLESDQTLIAVVNANLLKWDRKASHPWMAIVKIGYNGNDNNGMPDEEDYEKLSIIEEEIMALLIDKDGYLNVGRQTGIHERSIFFACKDFRLPSKVFFDIQMKYGNRLDIEFDIFKDKYWHTLERFNDY